MPDAVLATPPLHLSLTRAPVLGGHWPLAPLDAALLAWLALEGPTDRSRIAALLWPASDAEAARNSLRQRLFKLRRQCGVALVQGTHTLALADGVTHDLAEADAVLGDADPAIGPEFDAWLAQQRQRARDRIGGTLALRCRTAEQAGDWPAALALAHELLALAPLSEEAHRRLMRLHYLAGDRSAALLAFDRCERVLKDEVGARPSAETLALLRTVEAAQPPALPPGALQGRAVPASVLRPPLIVGRDAEQAALVRAWAEVQAVVVTGDGGLGKSRLIGDHAARVGGALLTSARPGDDRVAWSTASRLLRQLARETLAAQPAAVRAELAHLLPELGEASVWTQPADRSRLLNAAAAVLGPRRCIVDDLHFADEASIELLQVAWSAGEGGWIVAAREAEVGPRGRAWLAAMQSLPGTVTLPLQPLTLAAVAALVDSLGLPELRGEQAAPALLRHTGGNPLYLLETIKAWLAQGGSSDLGGARLPATRNVGTLIGRRIAQLSPAAVRLARCAAVATPDFSIELASQVLGLQTLDLADPWAELEAAQVLHDGAFAHDLIHEAALASVPAPVARQLHADIAAVLERQGVEPARVAAHWEAAQRPAQALEALRAAASAARQAMRKTEEIALLGRAAAIAEALGRHAEAFDALMDRYLAITAVDRTQVDEAVLQGLERTAQTPAQRLRARLSRMDHARIRGDYAESLALGESTMAAAQEAGEPAIAVEAARYAASSASFMGQSERAVRILRPLLPWVIREAPADLQQGFYGDLACCLDNADQPVDAQPYHRLAFNLAMQSDRKEEAVIAATNLCASLKNSGRIVAALAQAESATRLAGSFDRLSGSSWHLDMARFSLLRDAGRYADALHAGEAAQRAAAQHPPARLLLAGHFACLWLHLGQHTRAVQALDAVPMAQVPPFFRARLAQLRGRAERAMGQRGEAALDEARAYAPQAGRTGLMNMVLLDHALLLPPGEALALALRLQQQCEALGYAGVAMAARIRACAFARAAGELDTAVRLAHELMAAPPDVVPDDLYAGERWLHAAQAHAAAGDAVNAAAAQAAGGAWVRQTAAQQVPEHCRESFLHRQPVNVALLATLRLEA